MCGRDGVAVEDPYSVFTFDPLHNLHLEESRPSEMYSTQYFSSGESFSHLKDPPGKRERVSLVRLPLLNASSGIIAHIEEKYPSSGLHGHIAEKERRRQLSSPSTGDDLPGMMERRSWYAVDTVFPFVEAHTNRKLGFAKRDDLSRMNMLYTETVIKMLLN